ncbi:Outer membrane protein 26 precursor [Phocoenobacter uteri]|uniref:Outer membrane protein 26 n=1 Tax=Phocoenobacter uteri TaxID=146806 RepID=A0A379C810_9PAST|nr:OmpH family outer membrane protein [Phocoenobacter uteri]MDG6882197.1 hypothetical protein [Phocoenobacter uteri]SUB58351.1 Outer membrane protein 26 precursor [Phocoenobacter uteri]
MKKVFKIATIVTSLALASNIAVADNKIGFITPEFVIQNHPLFSASSDFAKGVKEERNALAEIEKKLAGEEKALVEEGDKLKKEEDGVVKEIQAKSEKLKKDAPRLRSKDIQKRQDEISKIADKFQQKMAAFQEKRMAFGKKVAEFRQKAEETRRKLAMEEAKVRGQVVKQIDDKLKEIATDKGYNIVLDSSAVMFTTEQENDLSDEVLKAVGGVVPQAQPEAK